MNNYYIYTFIVGITLCLTGNVTFGNVFKSKKKADEYITYEFDTNTEKNRASHRLHIVSGSKIIDTDAKTVYIIHEKTNAKNASIVVMKNGETNYPNAISLSIPHNMPYLGLFHTYVALFDQINHHYNKVIIMVPGIQQYSESQKNNLTEAMIRAFVAYRYANKCSFNDLFFVSDIDNKPSYVLQEKLCDEYYATNTLTKPYNSAPLAEKKTSRLDQLKTIIKSRTVHFIGIGAIGLSCIIGGGAFLYAYRKNRSLLI